MADAAREACPSCIVTELPLSDGGEGTLDVLSSVLGADIHFARVPDPLGGAVSARFAVKGELAVIEAAQACGLSLIPPSRRNPLIADTKGLGELIVSAYGCGCRRFLVALGGSGTCDGGAGMLSVASVREILKEVSVTILCDVDNPFIGPEGAARVFGPQKGASAQDVEILEGRMVAMAARILEETGTDVSRIPGAGAAGGLGGAFVAYSGAEVVSGIETVLQMVGFESELSGADLVITGEGRSDSQTLRGKVPMGVLRHSGGIPVALVSGSIESDASMKTAGFRYVAEVTPPGMKLEEALRPDIARNNIRNAIVKLLSGLI